MFDFAQHFLNSDGTLRQICSEAASNRKKANQPNKKTKFSKNDLI